jgi:triphosphoribosyl-dephospho-CoA synthase
MTQPTPTTSGGSDAHLTPSAGRLAEVACLLEVTVRKPGNVHRSADLAGLRYVDFVSSAAAIAGPLDRAVSEGVGAAVLAAIQATRRVVSTNTNLGIVLLLAPLAAVPRGIYLAGGLAQVLAETTVADACQVYRAIRLAQPGGLGEVAEQDVSGDPTITLREAMALGAQRDTIALQYTNGFREVLSEGLPMLREQLQTGVPLETAIVAVYLNLLSRHPDSLIARKHGLTQAAEVSRRAAGVLEAGWPGHEQAQRNCDEFDAWLRQPDHRFNPGTTADLVTAVLYAALRDESITSQAYERVLSH